jgi:uncharacterized membrane protein YfcA
MGCSAAGVGGGVLFVADRHGFFPFHIDFVRGAGLLVALASALAAGPGLLARRTCGLTPCVPLALVASASSIAGALIGLSLSPQLVQTALGITILASLYSVARETIRIHRTYQPRMRGRRRCASTASLRCSLEARRCMALHRTPAGLAIFVGIGILAGVFGLERAGPTFPPSNLVMGARCVYLPGPVVHFVDR